MEAWGRHPVSGDCGSCGSEGEPEEGLWPGLLHLLQLQHRRGGLARRLLGLLARLLPGLPPSARLALLTRVLLPSLVGECEAALGEGKGGGGGDGSLLSPLLNLGTLILAGLSQPSIAAYNALVRSLLPLADLLFYCPLTQAAFVPFLRQSPPPLKRTPLTCSHEMRVQVPCWSLA